MAQESIFSWILAYTKAKFEKALNLCVGWLENRDQAGKILWPGVLPHGPKSHSNRNERAYRQYLGKDLKVGVTGAIREGMGPTTKWSLDRIKSLRSSINGYVKAVDLASESGTITRPNGNLVILATNKTFWKTYIIVSWANLREVKMAKTMNFKVAWATTLHISFPFCLIYLL